MNNTAKQKLINSILYIVLALVAVAIMGITVFSFATAANKQSDVKLEEPQTKTPESMEKQTSNSGLINKEELKEKELIPPSQTDASAVEPDTEAVDVKQLTFTAPVNGTITKDYSDNQAVYSLTMNDYRTHNAIDISGVVGAPVLSCADGTVTEIYDSLFMGKCISVDHGDGIVSRYMNLSPEIPSDIYVGASVKGGQVLAGIGESALAECADAPHLHFEMECNGVSANPFDYLDQAVFTSAEALEAETE